MIQEKSPCPERARTLLRGTTLHLYSAKGRTGNQKAPVHSGTGARSRYHPALYFNGYSITGTSVQTYYLRPGSSRVIDHGYVAPVFTIHRLSEAPNFRFPLVHSMYLFELDCKYTGWGYVCQMEIFCILSLLLSARHKKAHGSGLILSSFSTLHYKVPCDIVLADEN